MIGLGEREKEETRKMLRRMDPHAIECELHTLLQHLPEPRARDLAQLYDQALKGKLPTEKKSTKKKTIKKLPKKKPSGGLLDLI